MSVEVRRLIAFAALAAFCAHHWFLVVESSDAWRWMVCVAAGIAGALVLVGLRSQRRAVAIGGAALVFVAILAEGLVAIGIPADLLLPGEWDELRARLDRGLAGVSGIDTPYGGDDPWTRIGILAAVPLAIAGATCAEFWPLGSGRASRAIGLAVLLSLYATSVTWEAPSAELARGAVLFALVAAVLWLPGLRLPRLAPAIAAAGLAIAVALPLAARVDASDPLIGYTDWRVFGDEEQIRFNWNHTYGSLDWPQEGTEVFVATTDSPAYWKTFVLDEFDGEFWTRSSGELGAAGTAPDLAGAPAEVLESHSEWIREFSIRLTTLRSRLAITSGFPLRIEGIDLGDVSGDGTASAESVEIPTGDEYDVTAYIPDPARGELRRADGVHPAGAEKYTTLAIPEPQSRYEEEVGRLPAIASTVIPPHGVERSDLERASTEDAIALRGSPVDQLVKRTPYEPVLELTRAITADARTDFEAVSSIQRFLTSSRFTYDQDVPLTNDPLPEFLLRERAGYCQHFAGAMALMLRMSGIPARVVSGFAPGEAKDGGTYSVTDRDAHSWVEVLYPGIGWVTVDPTPADTPARTDLGVESLLAPGGRLDGAEVDEVLRGRDRTDNVQSGSGGGTGAEEDGASPVPFLAVLVLVGGAGVVMTRRRRRLRSPRGAELQLRELRDALPATGIRVAPGATLLAIQGRLSAVAGPDAARYAAALAESRFGRRQRKRPGPAERRAFRWALARSAGILGWWKALRAVPPGGPRG